VAGAVAARKAAVWVLATRVTKPDAVRELGIARHHRRKQRRTHREHDWTRFARGHPELDRDLDNVWYRK
jgi:hypothetical protein